MIRRAIVRWLMPEINAALERQRAAEQIGQEARIRAQIVASGERYNRVGLQMNAARKARQMISGVRPAAPGQ